ncbi:MAG: (2Fe-2S)-binding protein [Oceanococcaceae bacterium]
MTLLASSIARITVDNHSYLHFTMRMIVCVCHNVNEKRIAASVDEGVRSVKGLCMATRCGTQCGKCLPVAKAVLQEAMARQPSCGVHVAAALPRPA